MGDEGIIHRLCNYRLQPLILGNMRPTAAMELRPDTTTQKELCELHCRHDFDTFESASRATAQVQ